MSYKTNSDENYSANPVLNAGVPVAGILGVRAGYGSSGWAQLLRRDGSLPMTGALNMGAQNINNTNAVNATTLATTGAATIGGTLGVTGATTTNGLTNNGDLHTGRMHLTTTVANGAACVGLNGYQASTTAGSIASCINGVWTTPNATTAVLPCTTQTVGGWNASGGSSGSCFGSATGAASGSTVTVTASSGGTGTASYMCSGGLWIWQSGSCTPTPCPTQTVSWGGGCSGIISGAAAGASGTVSASNGVGTATATCSSTGSGAWSTPSGSCTVFSGCSGYATWCGGKLGNNYSISHGSSSSISASTSNTYGGQDLGGSITGSASLSCNNGSVTYNSRSCGNPPGN